MGWGTKFFSHALAAGLCLVFQANQSQAQDSFDLNAGILPVSPLVVQDQEKTAIRYLELDWRQILKAEDPTIQITDAPSVRAWEDGRWPYGLDVKSHALGWEITKIAPGSSADVDGALKVGDVIFAGMKNAFREKLDPAEFDNTPLSKKTLPPSMTLSMAT